MLGIFDILLNLPINFLEFFLSKEEKIKRKLKKAKIKNVGDLKVGDYVKIEGVIRPYNKTITSPISRKSCIGYQVLVGREMSDYYEENYITEEMIHNFFLTDGDEKILVIPKQSRIDLKKTSQASTGLLKDGNSYLTEFLKRHKTKIKSFGFNKSLNFKEGILEEGQKISVLGKVCNLKSSTNQNQIVIRNLDKHPLFIRNY